MEHKCSKCGAGESLLTPIQPKWMQETLKEYWACGSRKDLTHRGYLCYEAELRTLKELLGDFMIIVEAVATLKKHSLKTGTIGIFAKDIDEDYEGPLFSLDVLKPMAQALLARAPKS